MDLGFRWGIFTEDIVWDVEDVRDFKKCVRRRSQGTIKRVKETGAQKNELKIYRKLRAEGYTFCRGFVFVIIQDNPTMFSLTPDGNQNVV